MQPIHNGQQYTKYVYFNVPVGTKKFIEEGKWIGHDWDVGEEDRRTMFHTTMCIPSVLLLWKVLVGGEQWREWSNPKIRKWKIYNYKQILVDAGAIAEQGAKQKSRQRLFYARIEDYVDSPDTAMRVKYKKTVAKFKEMKWVCAQMNDELLKERLKRLWYKWKLNTIHIVREGSSMNYNEETRKLFIQLNMQVRAVEPKNVDFLEELFGLIRDTLVTKNKWNKVARDKKLLYLPFDTCVDIRSAISAHYCDAGDGTLSGDLKSFVSEQRYKEGVNAADADITAKLLAMINTGRAGKNMRSTERIPDETSVAFQTSLLVSDVHHPQEAHVDYDTETTGPEKYMVAFLPLTETGQFLQFWDKNGKAEGEIFFIPKGQMLMVPGDTIHGGGFRADHRTDGAHAHMRLHFYVYPGTNECVFAIKEHKNDYVARVPTNYCNHKELNTREKGTQEDAKATLGNSFFHGYSV